MTKRTILGKDAKEYGKTPSIILTNPKHDYNVAEAVRAASCFGVEQVWYTGNRVRIDDGQRLRREERLRGYDKVELIQFDYPFEQFDDAVPVAVEIRPQSESLPYFDHPENAVYVFGPEDGHLDRMWAQHCHRFVSIPVRHCMNLASAIYVVLYDRIVKHGEMLHITQTLEEDRVWAERGQV